MCKLTAVGTKVTKPLKGGTTEPYSNKQHYTSAGAGLKRSTNIQLLPIPPWFSLRDTKLPEKKVDVYSTLQATKSIPGSNIVAIATKLSPQAWP